VARITCKTPSTGRAILISLANVLAFPTITTIAEAPDFSVPDPSQNYPTRDSDPTRAIRPGEIFFLTPLAAKNKSLSQILWIEARLITESGSIIEFGRASVPPNDTVFFPIQGRSLFKRIANGTHGDRLQITAELSNSFDVWAGAEEKLSAEHVGVTV
jgi:hypothetical protein